ncbi:MAG: DMT family transporter [Pseudomonadota bacterium]
MIRLLIPLAGVILLSPDSLLIRLAGDDIFTIAFIRAFAVACWGLGYWLVRYRKDLRTPLRNLPLAALLVGCLIGLGNLSFVYAISMTTVANVLLTISIMPVLACICGIWIIKEFPSTATWICTMVIMIGLGTLAFDSLRYASDFFGIALSFGVALNMAIGMSVIRRYQNFDVIIIIGLASFVVSLLMAPFVDLASLEIGTMVPLAIGFAVSVGAGGGLISIAARYVAVPIVGITLLLEAILAPLLVWAVFAEIPSTTTVICGVVIMSTMVVFFACEYRTSKSPKAT